MTETYDCPACDNEHPVSTDKDGYDVTFCPQRGTSLVDRPDDT